MAINRDMCNIVHSDSSSTIKRLSSDRSVDVPKKVRKLRKQATQDDNVSATDDKRGQQSLFAELCKDSDALCPESWKSICDSDYVCFAKLQVQ